MLFSRPNWPEYFAIQIDGRQVRVGVKVNARSRSYRLSIARNGSPIVTVPTRGKAFEVEAFLVKQKNWLAVRLNRAPKAIPFVDGAIVPVRGTDMRIVGTSQLRGLVSMIEGDDARLLVPGGPEHLSRRLTDWFKKQALADLTDRTNFHADRLDCAPSSITVRTQSSRWGSCSSAKRLNYNWRLILAPPFVLDYVAAHEVAHLREMNHAPQFWALVEQTLPDMARGQAWLKANGAQLMAYGLAPGETGTISDDF